MTEAKLKYKQGSFEIERWLRILCGFKKKDSLNELRYWNVDLQEAYFSPIEVEKKLNEKLKILIIFLFCSQAYGLEFNGKFTQGGLIIGKTILQIRFSWWEAS